MSVLVLCKFTPLGFETRYTAARSRYSPSVNLPRWGLKLHRLADRVVKRFGVNLPRWGLKQIIYRRRRCIVLCKFTPLGFET